MAVLINTEHLSTAPEIKCHLLPCELQYDGEANVSSYFETTIRSAEMTASMHGRPLNGEVKTIPSGYTGIVLHEARKVATEDQDRQLDIKSKFNEFTYWNLDKVATSEDKLLKALQWIEVASILHNPIDGEQSSQTSVTGK